MKLSGRVSVVFGLVVFAAAASFIGWLFIIGQENSDQMGRGFVLLLFGSMAAFFAYKGFELALSGWRGRDDRKAESPPKGRDRRISKRVGWGFIAAGAVLLGISAIRLRNLSTLASSDGLVFVFIGGPVFILLGMWLLSHRK